MRKRAAADLIAAHGTIVRSSASTWSWVSSSTSNPTWANLGSTIEVLRRRSDVVSYARGISRRLVSRRSSTIPATAPRRATPTTGVRPSLDDLRERSSATWSLGRPATSVMMMGTSVPGLTDTSSNWRPPPSRVPPQRAQLRATRCRRGRARHGRRRDPRPSPSPPGSTHCCVDVADRRGHRCARASGCGQAHRGQPSATTPHRKVMARLAGACGTPCPTENPPDARFCSNCTCGSSPGRTRQWPTWVVLDQGPGRPQPPTIPEPRPPVPTEPAPPRRPPHHHQRRPRHMPPTVSDAGRRQPSQQACWSVHPARPRFRPRFDHDTDVRDGSASTTSPTTTLIATQPTVAATVAPTPTPHRPRRRRHRRPRPTRCTRGAAAPRRSRVRDQCPGESPGRRTCSAEVEASRSRSRGIRRRPRTRGLGAPANSRRNSPTPPTPISCPGGYGTRTGCR